MLGNGPNAPHEWLGPALHRSLLRHSRLADDARAGKGFSREGCRPGAPSNWATAYWMWAVGLEPSPSLLNGVSAQTAEYMESTRRRR